MSPGLFMATSHPVLSCPGVFFCLSPPLLFLPVPICRFSWLHDLILTQPAELHLWFFCICWHLQGWAITGLCWLLTPDTSWTWWDERSLSSGPFQLMWFYLGSSFFLYMHVFGFPHPDRESKVGDALGQEVQGSQWWVIISHFFLFTLLLFACVWSTLK